ncbi:MAG: hypothetical protein KDC45_08040 [Bacteroidetes bacterium]|nr:hypothetical protein [Bacteroidota bacterium]
MKSLLIIAHRGVTYSGFPENSLPAFQAVLDEGYDGVEMDVRLTRDKELVVFHDIRLERLTTDGRGMVRTKTLEQLKVLRLKSEIVDTGIPTLKDVLELYRGSSALLNIEIKSELPLRGRIEQRVVDMIYDCGLSKQIIISSFNPLVINKIRQVDDELKTGFIYEKRLPRLNQRLAKGLIVDSWHPNFNGVTEQMVTRARDTHCTIFPWTVNEENDFYRMRELNVDGVITDFPNRARAFLRR